MGNQALTSFETYPVQLFIDGSNSVTWIINQNICNARKKVAGVNTVVGSNLAYDANIHKYFKIREADGVTYWDWSTDGIIWTNLTSTPNVIAMTSLKCEPTAGTFGTEASGTTSVLDNFNYVPTNKPGNVLKSIRVPNGMSRSEVAY